MATKRFATLSKDEIQEKRKKTNSENTLKANQRAARAFRAYLTEKEQDPDFEQYEVDRLNEALGFFYLEARTPDGELYKANSLESLRHGLNRYLKSEPHNKNFDLVKDVSFNDANQHYKAAVAELKREGKGDTEHHPALTEEDLQKLYNSVHMNTNTPTGLLNKVQFDIRLYFLRRGKENMHTMLKSTFAVKEGANGSKYVEKQRDELTKNHRGNDRSKVSGIMPSNPESPYCPVASFEKYLSKLHPSCDRLWQRPLDTFVDESAVWYCNSPIGERTLSKFMPELSMKCCLSQKYVNHSIRSTAASILTRNKFDAGQVMGVSGHKSVSSLAVYQNVNTQDKIEMGNTITITLTPQNQVAIPGPAPNTNNNANPPNNGENLLELPDNVLADLVNDMPAPQPPMAVANPANPLQIGQALPVLAGLTPGNMPILIGCSIGNLQIINKLN